MKRTYSLYILLLIVIFEGCTKDENIAAESDKIVMEGYLIRGQPVTITVTQLIPYETTVSNKYVDTLHIQVKQGNNVYRLPNIGNGEYYLPVSSMPIEEGKTYELAFTYNGKQVTASTMVPTKPENYTLGAETLKVPSVSSGSIASFPDPVQVKWKNNNAGYYLIAATNYESNPEPIVSRNANPPTFRTEPIQTNTYELGFQSFSYLGNHYIVLFHLQDEYTALYKNSSTTSIDDPDITYLDDFKIHVSTLRLDSFTTSGHSVSMLGTHRDTAFGKFSSNSYAENVLPGDNPLKDHNATYDSMVLILKPNGQYYGDTMLPFTISVHQLLDLIHNDDDNDNLYYYSRTFPYSRVPLGQLTTIVKPVKGKELHVHLSDLLGQDWFNKFKHTKAEVEDSINSISTILDFA